MAIKSIKNFFKNFTEEKNDNTSNISISSTGIKPKDILLIFPLEKDFFRVASYAYRNLPYERQESTFHYLVNENYIDSFSLRKGEIIKIQFDSKMNILNENDLLSSLAKTKYDIIVDLNITFQPKIENFIMLESNYKIGFKHHKSDKFYNVQLDISKSEIAEKGYQQIIDLI